MPTALIIGGGPAGSAAAIGLCRLGWNVTLIEQHRFPRDKVCGECLSAIGFDVLQRLNLAERFRRAQPVKLTRTIFHSRDGSAAEIPLPRTMWGISRALLDGILMDAARQHGAHIRQPARCEAIEPSAAIIRDLPTNVVETIPADCIVLADGKCALISDRPALTGDWGIKVHLQDVNGPRDAVELFALPGHYGGLAPITNGLWNAAFSVPQHRLQAYHGNLDALLDQLTRENVNLERRLKSARPVGAILAAPLPRFAVKTRFPLGIIPVGNAAAAMEPIGGEGMGLALASAELATHWLDSRHRAGLPCDYADLAPCFARLWKGKRLAYRTAAMLASNRTASSAAIEFLASSFGQQSLASTLKFLLAQDPLTVER